jgi:hypothetical protein
LKIFGLGPREFKCFVPSRLKVYARLRNKLSEGKCKIKRCRYGLLGWKMLKKSVPYTDLTDKE